MNTNGHRWVLQCFGGLRAVAGNDAGQSVERFRTQKTAALLALLALRGPQNREAVCAQLWPDTAPEAARNSLSAALSSLRRELGEDALSSDRQRVALAPGAVATDVEEFDAALRTEDWAKAVALYRGSLLPGFHEEPFPALAGEYEEKARGAFAKQLENLEREGAAETLRSLARRAITLFGEDERWFLALMQAHRMAGDLDAALRAYDTLLRHARKEGEVASEAARQLAKTLRREKEGQAATTQPAQQPAITEPVRHSYELAESTGPASHAAPSPISATLPTQWTRFFGREAEREMLHEWLRRGERLITLLGAGGSGKTRLAVEILREDIPGEAGGRMHFVPLASLQDADLLLSAIRDALGMAIAPDSAPLEQLERALHGQRVLLLLDNFEQLMPDGADRLQTLRERLPNATFLVTSRILLRLPGEREFPVAPLPTPLQQSALDDVLACPSAALFCDRADLKLNPENVESVGALCRRLDGIPLALELAAARVRVLSPAQILERLERHPDFLQSREVGVPARHKTLRATIQWSADLLSPELRAFFLRLSSFRGGWTLEAAEEICEEPDALEALTQLRESSLVLIEQTESKTRFRMLETLREFGQEQLGADEQASIERAFFDYFLRLAQQAAGAMRGPEQTEWLRQLDTEQDNVRAALNWAREHDPQRGLLLATALIDFWETRLSLDEGRHWIETFLEATSEGETVEAPPALEVRSTALSGAGRLAWYASDLDEAGSLLEEGLEAARQSGDQSAVVYATHSLARLTAVAGDGDRARELGHEGVRISRELGDKSLLLTALIDLGLADINASDFAAARQTHREAIALAREVGDDRALCLALINLAIAEHYDGQNEAARPLISESETLCRRLGAHWELMVCLALLGRVAGEQGEVELTQAAFHESLEICRDTSLEGWNIVNLLFSVSYGILRHGDAQGATCLMAAAEALRVAIDYTLMPVLVPENQRHRAAARKALGESAFEAAWNRGSRMTPPEAIDFALSLTESPEANRDANSSSLQALRARALSGAGRLTWYGRDLGEAGALLEQGFEAAQQSGDPSALVYATRSLARLAALEGDIARAQQLGVESVRLSREINDQSLLLGSLVDLSFADFNACDFAAVREASGEAIALARKVGDEQALAFSLLILGIICDHEENLEEALALVTESEALCRRLGVQWELMVCLAVQGSIFRRKGDYDRSQAFFNEALTILRAGFLNSWNVVNTLLAVSYLFFHRGDAEGAVRLMGASQALGEAINYSMMPHLVPENQRYQAAAREVLGSNAFASAWQQGRDMTPETAVDFAIRPVSPAPDSQAQEPATPKDASSPQHAASLKSVRARALSGAGRLAWHGSESAASRSLVNRGLDMARQAGDVASFVTAVAAFVRFAMTTGDIEGDIARARTLSEEAVQLSREAGNHSLLLESLIALGYARTVVNDLKGVRAIHEEAVAIARELGDNYCLVRVLNNFATLNYCEGNYKAARILLDESESICRRIDSPWDLVAALWTYSGVAREQNQLELAYKTIAEVIGIYHGNSAIRWGLSNVLLTSSYLFFHRGDAEGAARLMGFAETLCARVGYQLVPLLRIDYDYYRALARQELGESAFEAAFESGGEMTDEQAMEFALRPPVKLDKQPNQQQAKAESEADSASLKATRARALSGAAQLAWHGSQVADSRALMHQGLELARQSGEVSSFVHAVATFVRFAMTSGDSQGDLTRAKALSEEAVQLSRENGDRSLLLESLLSLVYVRMTLMDWTGLRAPHEEAVALAREIGDNHRLTRILTSFASLAYNEGRYAEACSLANESERIARHIGSPWDLLAALWTYSSGAREQNQLDLAYKALTEVIGICRENPGIRWAVAHVLLTTSYLFFCLDDAKGAAQLMGAAEAVCEEANYELMLSLRLDYDRYRSAARRELGNAAFEAAFRQGHSMTAEQAMDFALQPSSNPVAGAAQDDSSLMAARARALSGAGRIVSHGGDLTVSRSLVEQGLETARRSGDDASFVYAVSAFVRFAMTTGDIEGDIARARTLSEEAVQLSRQSGDRSLLLESLLALGHARIIVGDWKGIRALHLEAIGLAREVGDEHRLVDALTHLGLSTYYQGNYEEAREPVEEAMQLARRLDSTWGLLGALWTYINITREQGQLDASHQALIEEIQIFRDNPSIRWGLLHLLIAIGYLFFRRGDTENAARMMGAAGALCDSSGYRIVPVLQTDYERYQSAARREMGDEAFDAAFRRGQILTPEQAMDFFLSG